ncbi:MAG: hypothetical protein CMK59_13530 [Proteobacteria bacterium]|nr:hypothetical protein [Pseudomonadota bacterium]
MSGTKQKIQNRTQEILSSLTSRDKMLLLTLGVVLLILGVNWGVQTTKGTLDDLNKEISSAEQNLDQIKIIKSDQEELSGRLESLESQLQAYEKTDLSAYLEKSAQKVGINKKLDAVTPKTTVKNDLLEERSFNINLRDLTLEELIKFLYEIETSGYPLQIQNCNIRTRKSRSGDGIEDKVLRVTMDISTYKLLESL